MTEPKTNVDAADPRHYQVLCALALGFVFVLQLDQEFLLGNLLLGVVGLLGFASPLRIGALLFLAVFGLCQAGPAALGFPQSTLRQGAVFDLNHLILAAAVLTYVIGLYRLQAIWNNILPLDPRERAGPPQRSFPWFAELPPIMPQRRPPASLTRREIGILLVSVTATVGLAQAAWLGLAPPRSALDMPTRLWQMVIVAWTLAVGSFLVRHILLVWKRRALTSTTALMVLQDVLWKETRGEQRRVQRWLAWHRVRQHAKAVKRNPE